MKFDLNNVKTNTRNSSSISSKFFKRILSNRSKRNSLNETASDTKIEKSLTDNYSDNHFNKEDYDYVDLVDFFNFISTSDKKKSSNELNFNLTTNNTISNLLGKQTNQTDKLDIYYELPVALIQLFILILVFLIVLFLCKCNKIMEFFREKTQRNPNSYDDDSYNDRITLRNYFNSLCYNFKMRRRLQKRRRRRKHNIEVNRHENVISNGVSRYGGRRGAVRYNPNARNNSLIFRRRSAIYRNNRKIKKTDSFNSASSLDKRTRRNFNNLNNTNKLNLASSNNNATRSSFATLKSSSTNFCILNEFELDDKRKVSIQYDYRIVDEIL